ncbi:hypothetical protein V6N11_014433 [Hibiscus sabdariffa]|uniref:Uncharacterized protein n=2 Tax=Hibiscus sabdariffa TaxID=183260 RepID=A0ABR2AR12_9ROSI
MPCTEVNFVSFSSNGILGELKESPKRPEEATPKSTSTKIPPGKTLVDRPIIGMIVAHWNEDESSSISPKSWDGNRIPNSTNKYNEGEDQMRKGLRWIPRHPEMRKGVLSDEMLRGVKNKSRSEDSRIGQPFELLLNPWADKRQPGETTQDQKVSWCATPFE